MGFRTTASIEYRGMELRLRLPEGETLERAVSSRMAVLEVLRPDVSRPGNCVWLDYMTVREGEEIEVARRCLLASAGAAPLKLSFISHNYADFRITRQSGGEEDVHEEDVASISIDWCEDAREFAARLRAAADEFDELARVHPGETLTVDPDMD